MSKFGWKFGFNRNAEQDALDEDNRRFAQGLSREEQEERARRRAAEYREALGKSRSVSTVYYVHAV